VGADRVARNFAPAALRPRAAPNDRGWRLARSSRFSAPQPKPLRQERHRRPYSHRLLPPERRAELWRLAADLTPAPLRLENSWLR